VQSEARLEQNEVSHRPFAREGEEDVGGDGDLGREREDDSSREREARQRPSGALRETLSSASWTTDGVRSGERDPGRQEEIEAVLERYLGSPERVLSTGTTAATNRDDDPARPETDRDHQGEVPASSRAAQGEAPPG